MNLDFHYCAVKTVARAAGFNEDQAQRIAVYSQFVDDYNWYSVFAAGNIPDYLKSDDLDIVTCGYIINPVTTGFSDLVDMASLITPRSQKFTVAPFHFIPQITGSDNHRTSPAKLHDGSFISGMLENLRTDYRAGGTSENDLLMRMGMLFHTFSDTYAHQLFSGYNESINKAELISITNNINGADETAVYKTWLVEYLNKISKIVPKVPAIGHMTIAHVPDLSHLSFEMKYTDDNGKSKNYSRNNTDAFVSAGKELYDYIRGCLDGTAKADMEWAVLKRKLKEAFLTDISVELESGEQEAMKKLAGIWKSIFPNYTYSYNSNDVKKSLIIANGTEPQKLMVNGQEEFLFINDYSDDFYKFNLYADKYLISLYGDHPRRIFAEETRQGEGN